MKSQLDTSAAEDDPTAETLILLENEIALGRQFGMAGQTLGAMCSARDEINRLHAELEATKGEISPTRALATFLGEEIDNEH